MLSPQDIKSPALFYDGSAFQYLVDKFRNDMVIFSDMGFEKIDWFPTNLRTCKRGDPALL